MNLETHTLSGAAALVPSGSAVSVRTAVTANGRTTFRRIFGLRLRTGGIADAVRIDGTQANVAIEFEPTVFDARDAGDVSTTTGGGVLIVSLPVPLQLQRIRFASTTVPTGTTVEIFRMDGDERAEEPTKSPGNNANVPGDFTDRRFGLRVAGVSAASLQSALRDVSVRGFPTGARLGLAEPGAPEDTVFFWTAPGEVGREGGPAGNVQAGPPLAEALTRHIDSLPRPLPETVDRLLVAESDAPCQLRVQSFHVPVELTRSSFRAVLLRASDIVDVRALTIRLRDASAPFPAYLRGRLTAATLNGVDRPNRRAGIPDSVPASIVRDVNHTLQAEAFYTAARFSDVSLPPALVAAATATTTAGTARTRINRNLLELALPDAIAAIPDAGADEKEVLRARGATGTLDVAFDFPRAANVLSATLRLEADLRGDAPSSAAADSAVSDWDAPVAGARGITVDAGLSAALGFTPSNAMEASGLALALGALARDAELTAEIREDRGGSPAGRVTASGSANIRRLDRPRWVHFAFAKPVVLASLPHWIVLRAGKGTAVWFAENGALSTRVGTAEAGSWTDRASFDDLAPMHQIWSARTTAPGTVPETGARLRVTLGATNLAPTTDGAGRVHTIDLTAALNAWLAAQPASPPLLAVPLRIAALGTGTVTVYPPIVAYVL